MCVSAYLVAEAGIAPTSEAYEAPDRLLIYTAIELAGRTGIEPVSILVNSQTLSP